MRLINQCCVRRFAILEPRDVYIVVVKFWFKMCPSQKNDVYFIVRDTFLTVSTLNRTKISKTKNFYDQYHFTLNIEILFCQNGMS